MKRYLLDTSALLALRDESEKEGRLAYQQCLALLIVWIRESKSLSMRAAELKGQHSSSVADA